jgi:hypothetical protein
LNPNLILVARRSKSGDTIFFAPKLQESVPGLGKLGQKGWWCATDRVDPTRIRRQADGWEARDNRFRKHA